MTRPRFLIVAAIGVLSGVVAFSPPLHAATKSAAKKSTATKSSVTKKPAQKATVVTEPAADTTAAAAKAAAPAATPAPSDDYILPGGSEGTVFKSLTVEGEDRVHLEFERPELSPDVDPHTAPGLDPAGAGDVLMRSGPDLLKPYASMSALDHSIWVARPWLSSFATGDVARFRPQVTEVARWRLLVANAKGETVATMEGKGQPPREIAWDGRTKDGQAATPNLTYSYVFEAVDKAGNKRNFVGEGFKVSAYRMTSKDGTVLAFSGTELNASSDLGASSRQATPPILLEAASWLNRTPRTDRPIKVTVTSRSYEQAQNTAADIVRMLTPQIACDPSRIRGEAVVQADSPEGGTVVIAN